MKKITLMLLLIFVSFYLFSPNIYAEISEEELNKLIEQTSLENIEPYDDNLDSNESNNNPKNTDSSKDSANLRAVTVNDKINNNATNSWKKNKVWMETIIKRLNSMWLTRFSNIGSYKPNEFVTREQMAKMISLFAIKSNHQWDSNPNCWFSDIYMTNPDLIPYIISACTMGLMKWVDWRGLPKTVLNKWTSLAIIMNVVKNDIANTANPRYKNHYNTARAYWITKDKLENMTKRITRWELAIFLYRARQFKQ